MCQRRAEGKSRNVNKVRTMKDEEDNQGIPGCFWLAFIAAIVIIMGLMLYFDYKGKALEHDADIKALQNWCNDLRKRVEVLERASK